MEGKTDTERKIHTHTHTAHEQARDKEGEEDRDAKGQGGQSGEAGITGLCSELSAEVPGQNPPLEGLDSGGNGSQRAPRSPIPC